MEIEKVLANEKVKDDVGRFALQRGPIVYCIEGPDHVDQTVQNIVVPQQTSFSTKYDPLFLNGVLFLNGTGSATARQVNSDELLKKELPIKAIPYYSWNNRGPGEMVVWIPFEESMARPKAAPTIASKSKISASINNQRMLNSLNDQFEPTSSEDKSALYLHWWPKKNTEEWIQYTFDQEYIISESKVYWYDDSPFGGCRIPAKWELLYKQGDEWVPVQTVGEYELAKDKYNTVRFNPVKTTAIRMKIKLPVNHATGVHEWIVK